MQPNFANLKPVNTGGQPNFTALKPGQFPTEEPPAVKQSFASRINNFVQKTLPDTLGGGAKSILKDVAGLGTTAVARTTEAATRVLAPNSQAAKGYEAMADEGQSQNILGMEVKQPTARNIIGDTAKTASYLFPYGKVAGVASKVTGNVLGKAAAGAAGGYLADVGFGLSDEKQSVGEALTPGLGTALGASIPLAGSTLRGAGRATAKIGEKVAELGVPISSREAQILQAYKAKNPFMSRVSEVLKGTAKAPSIAGKTAVTTTAGQKVSGLFGTKAQIGIQARRASDSLWKDVINPRLKSSGQAVDMDGFFAKVEQDIISKTPEISRQKSLLEALKAYKEDYAGIKAVGLEQLQKYKEGWAKFVPEKAYKGKPIGGAFNDVRNELANEARTTIYSQLGDDVKQAYFDYGNLKGLQEMGQVAMTGAKFKGGAGSFMSELVSQAVTPIATVGGQAIYRVGKGIEFIGNIGAKNVGQALGITKFPGDKMVDDFSARAKDAKQIIKNTGSQGGYLNLGQDLSLPNTKQTSQIPANTAKTVNIPSTVPQSARIDELGQKINQLNKQWVNKPTVANKKALDNAKALYKDLMADIPITDRVQVFRSPLGTTTLPKRRITPKGDGAIPNQLATEARKYKSAEDFVKAQLSSTQYGDYTPALRKYGAESYTPITKLGVKPDEMVTIYRGIDDVKGNLPKKINNGDFVTTDFDSALSYAGSPKDVVSMKVPAKYLSVSEAGDFKAEPFYAGSEYIFTKEVGNPITKSQLTDIWKKAHKK